MNENTKTPIEMLTDALAEMTARAVEAERQRDLAKYDADEWYQSYKRKTTELSEALAQLNAQIEENEELRCKISELIERLENGGTENV